MLSRHPSFKARVALLAFVLVAAPASAEVETHQVPGGNGNTLSTDIYPGESNPGPVILIRTPYGRSGMAFLGEAFSRRGYTVAVQDVRGRYGSSGDHEPFRHERADGLATLKWIAAQPWCNGSIGMWGSSYGGYAALSVADAEIPSFKAIFSISGWLAVDEVVRPGGATHLMLNLPWMLTQQGRTQRNLVEFDVDSLFRHTPLREALRAAGIENATWEDSTWLDSLDGTSTVGKVDRPVLHVTGWHDMVYRAALDAWQRISEHTEAPQKLVVGPWYHNQFLFESWEVGDAHFGNASGFGTAEVIALSLRWFDATLKGVGNGILEEPPVTYFMMDQNAWQTSSHWPPQGKEIKRQRWYLGGGGKANGLTGDGRLSLSKPADEQADRFVFDPHNPVPTFGGAVFFYFPDLLGVRDQREIEAREDVLVYTSPPLDTALQITGEVTAHLRVATSGKDTDFTAKLVVVRADGYARIVEDGIARLSYRRETPYEPGEERWLDVRLGHTAIAVPAGHRLRIEISSSNFPKYDRNPNTGEDPFLARELRRAEQAVFHGAGKASYIDLPVQASPRVATAAARQPLIAAAEIVAPAIEAVEGDDASLLLAAGREQLDNEQADQAIATLKRAVELKPDGSQEHLWLGRAYLAKLNEVSMLRKLGFSKKVKASFMRAVELDGKSVDARSSLASFYFEAPSVAGGSVERGLEQVTAIGKLDPKAGHLLMAAAHNKRKKFDEAEREYRAAIQLAPQDPGPYYRLGLMKQGRKEWEGAFKAFEDGASVAGDARSLYQIGRTAVFSGLKLGRGRDALTSYIEQQPEGPGLPSVAAARWRLGMVFEKLGRKDLARKEYETSLKLDPEMAQAREALDKL